MKHSLWAIVTLIVGCVGAMAQPGQLYTSLSQVTDPGQVYRLQLRHQHLKALPAMVLEMTNLEELDLRGNRIVQLPDSICRLRNLRRLEMSRNPLMGLPAAMAQLDALEELVLWSTYVTDLPSAFARLDDSLQLLDLRNCPMTLDDQETIDKLLPHVKKLWDYACNCGE